MLTGIKSGLLCVIGVVLYTILLAPTAVEGTTLTYKIDANEKACFYTWVDKVGEKIAFYFAVLPSILS